MCGIEDKSGGIGIPLKSNRDNGKGSTRKGEGENGDEMRPASEATTSLFDGDRDGILKNTLKAKLFAIFFHLSRPLLPGKQAEMVILVSHCIRITCYVLKQLLFNIF